MRCAPFPLTPSPAIAPFGAVAARRTRQHQDNIQTTLKQHFDNMATVFRTAKGHSNSSGYEEHLNRTKEVKNANPELSQYNFHVVADFESGRIHCTKENPKESLRDRIDNRLKEGYNARNKAGELKEIRKDAVRYVDVVMTAGHDEMAKIVKDGKLGEWALQSYAWAARQFGAQNIVDFTCHVDEHTPHIHAVIVPLTADGRLCAKEILSKGKLHHMQTSYWQDVMNRYGIERGKEKSRATHQEVKTWYSQISKAMGFPIKPLDLSKPELQAPSIEAKKLFQSTREWLDEQNKAIRKGFDKAIGSVYDETKKMAEEQQKSLVTQKIQAEQRAMNAENEAKRLSKELNAAKRKIDMLQHPEKYEKKQEEKQEERRHRGRGL